jgi:hypothetical protein
MSFHKSLFFVTNVSADKPSKQQKGAAILLQQNATSLQRYFFGIGLKFLYFCVKSQEKTDAF